MVSHTVETQPGIVYNQQVQCFRKVLVALSRTDTDAGLMKYAAMLGNMTNGAEFHFVHAAEKAESRGWSIRGELEERAGRVFESAATQNDVSFHVIEGERTDALLTFAALHRTDLILLGHGQDRSGRRSLARRLAMQAPCSIWMAPEGSPARLRTVIVPIDFSEHAADALSVGTSVVEAAGLDECFALHVYFNKAAVTFDEYDDIIVHEKDQAFCLFIAPIDLHGVHVKPLFVEGASVASTINRLAAEHGADLIVMGTRGRSRAAGILLGSETEELIMETRIPLLAVKHFGARMRLVQVLLDKRLRERGDLRFT